MAHYTVNLPGGIPADVRQGRVFKKMMGLDKHWPWIKFKGEERVGYVVTVDAGHTNSMQYHLLKTSKGNWPSTAGNEAGTAVNMQGKWQPVAEDEITLAIKKAIDAYEKK